MNVVLNIKLIGILVTLAWGASFSVSSVAEPVSSTIDGQKVMAKFMEKLAHYVIWPESTFDGKAAPYKYCFMGENTLAGVVAERLKTTKVKKRRFDIQKLELGDTEQSKTCHLLFLTVGTLEEVGTLLKHLLGLPVLTTGEIKDFASSGGMVGFIGERRKIALVINKTRLESGRLTASSKLYRVSTM
jgi:hypothetical protein